MFYNPKTKNEDQEYSLDLDIWNLPVHGAFKSATIHEGSAKYSYW